ncbi:MAG: hypothetical protein LBC64_06540 [Fibromonadaceae bacterium]|nr:hypothetical protein [Fibromonadaceae bacterium]
MVLGCLARAQDSWFSADLPLNGKFYPVTARIHSKKAGNNIEFSTELAYRAKDTTFSMHSTGVYDAVKKNPVWQNSVRTGLYTVEWTFRDYTETPASVSWSDNKTFHINSTTFENDAVPEEFLYFLAEKTDSNNPSKDFKILSSVWEVSFVPDAWAITASYTGLKQRINGVDCYQVVYVRSDGARAEYYVTQRGKQVWKFKTFRGVWFDRIQ